MRRPFALTLTLAIGSLVATSVLAVEELPPPPASKQTPRPSDTPESTITTRVVDLIRFMMLLCDDQPVPAPLIPQRNICSISAHLSPQGIDLLEKQLKDPNALTLIRQTSPQVSQLLPILSAGAPLVRDMKPEVQLVMSRQDLAILPTSEPRPVLPAMAIIFEPNDLRKGKSLLLATYWSVVRGANDLAELDGTSQLSMRSGKRGEAFFAEAYFSDPPKSDDPQEQLRYNFTPAIGVAGSRCIVATSSALCAELLDLAQAQPPRTELAQGPRIDVGFGPAAGLVLDNLVVAAPSRADVSAVTQAQLDELSKILADTLKQLPNRPRPIANLVERIRERRVSRFTGVLGGL